MIGQGIPERRDMGDAGDGHMHKHPLVVSRKDRGLAVSQGPGIVANLPATATCDPMVLVPAPAPSLSHALQEEYGVVDKCLWAGHLG